MQLRYDSQIRNRIITIELETVNFTQKENMALERFGEPVIKFEKVYEGNFPVKFEKKAKTGFKLRVKFDGTEDLRGATNAANQFLEDIKEVLENEMAALMDKFADHESEFTPSKGYIDISY